MNVSKLTAAFLATGLPAVLYEAQSQTDRITLPGSIKTISMGMVADPSPWGYGSASFYTNGVKFYQEYGGGGLGRGFNVAVLAPSTGAPVEPVHHFDTWWGASYASPLFDVHTNLLNYLKSIPTGNYVMIAVGDEAGLNEWEIRGVPGSGQNVIQQPIVRQIVDTLQQDYGSLMITNLHYWDSFALITRKGDPTSTVENLARTNSVTVSALLPFSITLQRPRLYFTNDVDYMGSLVIVTEPNIETSVQVSNDAVNWRNWFFFVSANGVRRDMTLDEIVRLETAYGVPHEYYSAEYDYP